MGNAASSNVERIQLDPAAKISNETRKKDSAKNNNASKQTDSVTNTTEDKTPEVELLTKQLCESESLRLDLEDKVEALMKELEQVTAQNIEDEEKPCNETVHAKDQYIANLEKEKKDLQTETHKLKLKQRRKQKQFNTQMAEYKQEVNFQMMELRDEIKKLKTENKKLSGKKLPESDEDVEDSKTLPGGEKMALILELSNQVAEQEDKISKLERKLTEKDQIISEMRAKMKNNAQYLSVLNDKANEKSSTANLVKTDSHDRYSKQNVSTRVIGVAAANTSVQNTASKHKTDKIDHLFTVDEESSDNDDDNLSKLNGLLKGVKAKNDKVRLSTDSYDDDIPSSSPNYRQLQGIAEDLEGNTGRDSGLGSAGKRDENKKMESNNNDHLRNWKDSTPSFESGSGLSDSDFDVSPSSAHDKVYSAPPKLQNSGGVRLKKKSNSLRRHATSKKDRPPKPGVAFVNSTSSYNSDENIINKLSPIISRVEVS
ncbi:hypothetical protein ACF0H5_013743 [Mactra antiquata]